MSRPVPADWPDPGTLAVMVWPNEHARVRVEQVEADLPLVIVAPGAALPPPETELALQWSDAHGLYLRPIGFDRIKPRTLRLHATGAVEQVQRRRFFRARALLGAIVTDGRIRADGITKDLSEGGARLTLRGRAPAANSRVITRLVTEDGGVDVPSRIVRNRPGTDGVEVTVLFDELPAATESIIRRQVYNAQLEERRKELER